MRLVPDWKKSWTWFSMWAASVIVAWGLIPYEGQVAIAALLHIPAPAIPAVLGLLVMAGRLVSQKKDEA